MKDFIEALYYSKKQHEHIKARGEDVGVILINGAPLPWTETCTNMIFLSTAESHMHGDSMKMIPSEDVKSHFSDAFELYRGESGLGKAYKRLVNGLGEVTPDGLQYAEAHNIEATHEALLSVALENLSKQLYYPSLKENIPVKQSLKLSLRALKR